MKKSLTIFFTILCSWHLYAQLPVIPVPQTATMDTYGININPQTHSSTPSPFIKRAQSNAYDPNELERRNQRTQQEINAAVSMMREIKSLKEEGIIKKSGNKITLLHK